MKRAVQAVTVTAIACWVACIAAIQAAIWLSDARSEWGAEAWAWGVTAAVLTAVAFAGWLVLPPPDDQ